MDSPSDSQLSIGPPESAPVSLPNNKNEHYISPEVKGIHLLSRKLRKAAKSSLQPYQGWELPPENRRPYHQYVHDLVQGGWDILKPLDEYMSVDIEDQELVISVLDITDTSQLQRHPDIHDGLALKTFLDGGKPANVKVRLYMAEQRGDLAAGVMEALGSSLDLDPRFFLSALRGNKHVLAAPEHHRAPFTSMNFGVPKLSTPLRTDAEKFKVMFYVKPDDTIGQMSTLQEEIEMHPSAGDRWTGILLFNSHTKINLSSANLIPPPSFTSPRPQPTTQSSKSFRELYLGAFSHLDVQTAITSPFYTISPLLRFNCFGWGRVITSIRDEDRRIHGVSDTTVGHAEEIKKSLSLVQRGGSLGWKGADVSLVKETKERLAEDFKHLMRETELLWETRDKMASNRRQKAERRWSALTNTFTYVFAPITIISGIYGMNVSEISGSNSNPNIWQFFVAVVALNVVVMLALAISNWVHIITKHGRNAGAKEAFKFAVAADGR